MSRVFFAADMHFGHERLAINRRGMTIKEHDELIIHNWNSVVSKNDTVIMVGDVTFEAPELIPMYLSKLRGNKKLIAGNHDNIACCDLMRSLGIPVMGCLKYKGFFVTHIPIHPLEFDFSPKIRGNIHGHIHDRIINDPRYFNVSMDRINFIPILFEDIETMIMISKANII